jgi:hypothetical protein
MRNLVHVWGTSELISLVLQLHEAIVYNQFFLTHLSCDIFVFRKRTGNLVWH